MASTEITFNLEDGTLVPNDPAISVVSNDTVSFAVSDGRPAFLYFSPATVAILSPKPSIPFPLAPSTKAQFTFQTSDPGAYTLLVSPEQIFEPVFPESIGSDLKVEIVPPPAATFFPIVGSRTRDNQG